MDDPIPCAVADAQLPGLPLVHINAAFEQLTGYRPSDILGLNCRLLQGQETERDAVNAMVKALRNQKPCDVTITNYRKDGLPFTNILSLRPVLDKESGTMRFVVATLREQSEGCLISGFMRDDAAALMGAMPRVVRCSTAVPPMPRPADTAYTAGFGAASRPELSGGVGGEEPSEEGYEEGSSMDQEMSQYGGSFGGSSSNRRMSHDSMSQNDDGGGYGGLGGSGAAILGGNPTQGFAGPAGRGAIASALVSAASGDFKKRSKTQAAADGCWLGAPVRHHVAALRSLLRIPPGSETLEEGGTELIINFLRDHWRRNGRLVEEGGEGDRARDVQLDVQLSLHSKNLMRDVLEHVVSIVEVDKEFVKINGVGGRSPKYSGEERTVKVIELYANTVKAERARGGVAKKLKGAVGNRFLRRRRWPRVGM